jgi:hypothetical protein
LKALASLLGLLFFAIHRAVLNHCVIERLCEREFCRNLFSQFQQGGLVPVSLLLRLLPSTPDLLQLEQAWQFFLIYKMRKNCGKDFPQDHSHNLNEMATYKPERMLVNDGYCGVFSTQ